VIRHVTATRYVTPLREGGSLPAVVEADDDGLYVAKFRGAGHGVKALVAELVAGEIGRALGLLVPEIVLVDFDPSAGGRRARSGDPGTAPAKQRRQRRPGLPARLAWASIRPPALRLRPTFAQPSSGSTPSSPTWTATPATPTCSSGTAVCGSSTTARPCTSTTPGRTPRLTPASRWPRSRATFCCRAPASILSADDRLAPMLSTSLFARSSNPCPTTGSCRRTACRIPAAHRAAYLDYLTRRLDVHRSLAEEAERVRTAA
jgi:hypothetical protein